MTRYDDVVATPRVALAALLVAGGLAGWLLLRPELVSDLALPLRVPLIGLGAWALGAAFARPQGLRLGGVLRPLPSLAALGVFAGIVMIRAGGL